MIARKPLSICIATCDIVGPIRNGGIGTAYYALARALAAAGHRVTVLYALGQFCEVATLGHWQDVFAGHGIDFVPLAAATDGEVRGHASVRMSYGIYRWLKSRDFDVVHFHEWRGIGYYTAMAKHEGLCLGSATICVGAHSPVLWHREGMNEPATAEDLEVDFMERQSVALADVLWSPSRHMLDWMKREGWQLPRRIIVKPYIMPVDDRSAPAGHRQATPVRELVFFGRLETRKGLDLFCDALDRLVRANVCVPPVTFLGKPASVGGVASEDYLRARAARWTFNWQIVSDRDRAEAMRYLKEPGRLAILPSRLDNLPYTVLECLNAGIPFVSSNVGGIPEMIRPEDHDRVLFEFNAVAFAARLQTALYDGMFTVAPKFDAEDTNADWLEWHAGLRRRARARGAIDEPLVSICITHHNRAGLLLQTLDAVRAQDYPNIEVVLVDDGSDQLDARDMLDALEPEFQSRGWSIVRQANKYLGAARNTAVRHAQGKYVLFMDDDNVAVPHQVSTFVRAAEASGADILTCFLRVFQSVAPPVPGQASYCWPFLGAAIGPGLLRNVFGDANALVRRDVFTRVGGFTEDFGVGCEDWEFFARATLSGARLLVVPEPLVWYRQLGTGMLHTTSQQANRRRIMRPYFNLVPADWRPMIHLAHAPSAHAAPVAPARLDHVKRAVIFGTGEAGRRALELAGRCGWDVPYFVDNNETRWNSVACDRPVQSPQSLEQRDFDVVIVASLAGKQAILSQLGRMGFAGPEHVLHFLDPINVSGLTVQVSM